LNGADYHDGDIVALSNASERTLHISENGGNPNETVLTAS